MIPKKFGVQEGADNGSVDVLDVSLDGVHLPVDPPDREVGPANGQKFGLQRKFERQPPPG